MAPDGTNVTLLSDLGPTWDLVIQVEQRGQLFSDPNLYVTFVSWSQIFGYYFKEWYLTHFIELLGQMRFLRGGLLRDKQLGTQEQVWNNNRCLLQLWVWLQIAGRADGGAFAGHRPHL